MALTALKRLRCSLTLHFAVIAWLTAMLVATGSGSFFLPVFIFCVSIAAYIFVDRLEWFQLGRLGSYIGMLAATIFSVGSYIYSAFTVQSESGQLAAIAGLLVYPEAVLFLQRKNLRVFEQLAVFLLLEMIVAALVNDNILFGVLLAPIMLIWVSSLFLFSRYATLVQMDPGLDEPVPILIEILYRMFVKSVIGEKSKPHVVTTRTSLAEIEAGRGLRRTLQSIPLGIGAIVFAGFFFYLLPRTMPAQLTPSLGLDGRVGLPRTLSIGTIGRLKSDPTPVMRVGLKALRTGKPYPMQDSPYLRARVMDKYANHSRSNWGQYGEWAFGGVHNFRRLEGTELGNASLYPNRDLVKVEFDINQDFASTLFSCPPSFALSRNSTVPLRYDKINMVLEDLDATHMSHRKSLVYSIGSAAFSNGTELRIAPAQLTNTTFTEISNLAILTLDFREFTHCDQYRQNLLRDGKVNVANPFKVADFIERHFLNGDFVYTLDLRPPIDPDIDPIEDFLINQRKGHCQYFASAMLMMLRQSNIPSRIVVGYKPSEYNSIGEYFTVKQSDAHAWVEALMTQQSLQGTELERWATEPGSYWVRFDPTPGSSDDATVTQQGQAIDYAEKLWKDYVVEGQKLESEDSLYAPVAANSKDAYASLIEKIRRLRQQLESGELFSAVGRIDFAWRVAIAITALGGLLVSLWQGSKFLQRFAPRIANRLGLHRPSQRIKQAFYARCLDLLARRGLVRQPSETPEEFTQRASLTLQQGKDATNPSTALLTNSSAGPSESTAHSSLGKLTALYYRLRFGHNQTLSVADEHDIDQALSHLSRVTHRRHRI